MQISPEMKKLTGSQAKLCEWSVASLKEAKNWPDIWDNNDLDAGVNFITLQPCPHFYAATILHGVNLYRLNGQPLKIGCVPSPECETCDGQKLSQISYFTVIYSLARFYEIAWVTFVRWLCIGLRRYLDRMPHGAYEKHQFFAHNIKLNWWTSYNCYSLSVFLQAFPRNLQKWLIWHIEFTGVVRHISICSDGLIARYIRCDVNLMNQSIYIIYE